MWHFMRTRAFSDQKPPKFWIFRFFAPADLPGSPAPDWAHPAPSVRTLPHIFGLFVLSDGRSAERPAPGAGGAPPWCDRWSSKARKVSTRPSGPFDFLVFAGAASSRSLHSSPKKECHAARSGYLFAVRGSKISFSKSESCFCGNRSTI